jgi:hypothetical protein
MIPELLERATLIWLGLMSKLTWEQILRTYDVTQGDLWALVLVSVAALPPVLLGWQGPAQQL